MKKQKGSFQKGMKKFACLLLSLLFLTTALTACEKPVDPMAKSGFRELLIDEKGNVNAVVSLDLTTVQAHDGETVSLYEIAPDEDLSAVTSREPLDEVKVSSTLKFRFPLKTDGKTRLYSSFAVVFEDGSPLSTDAFYIQNPEALAIDTRAFPWAGSPKGLNVDDPSDAVSIGTMHAMYEVSLLELTNGIDTFSFQGGTYPISYNTLTQLEAKILRADELGMQTSLTLCMDTAITQTAYTALIDLIVSRYTKDGHCALTAIFLQVPDATNIATLCRTTAIALRSRMSEGRVFIAPQTTTIDDTKVFFSTVQAQLLAGGAMQWGAAVSPQCDPEAATTEENGILTVSALSDISSFLHSSKTGAPSWFSVCDISYNAESTDRQAASFAHAYRKAVQANADLIFYGSQTGTPTGLRDENGEGRRILSVFSSIDTGLSADDRRLCESLLPDWNSNTTDLVSRLTVGGVANAGTIGLEEAPLFDFTEGAIHGFVGIGASDAPVSNHSAAWNAPVLFTWVEPAFGDRGGVSKVLSDAALLRGATSTSIGLLCQIPDASSCTAHLTLEGTTAEGERLTYESSVEIQNGTWQSVTFQIGNFTADADLSKPVVLTLTTSSDNHETDEPYALWVKSMNVRRSTESGLHAYLPIIVIAASLAVGFLATFLIYRKTGVRRIRRK